MNKISQDFSRVSNQIKIFSQKNPNNEHPHLTKKSLVRYFNFMKKITEISKLLIRIKVVRQRLESKLQALVFRMRTSPQNIFGRFDLQ